MKFTEEHEWLRVEGDEVVVGITDHAAEELGDIVFVELPEPGTTVTKDDEIVVIESVKAASDILAPIDGEITAVNDVIADEPAQGERGSDGRWLVLSDQALGPITDGRADGRGRLQGVHRLRHAADKRGSGCSAQAGHRVSSGCGSVS